MNEEEFLLRYILDKPIFQAWGEYLAGLIISKIDQQIQDLAKLLMLPVSPRLKEDSAILAKAFF